MRCLADWLASIQFGKKVLGIQNLGCDERGCYNMVSDTQSRPLAIQNDPSHHVAV